MEEAEILVGRTGDSEFDVIVSGGGLTGVVCAVQLARSGRRVGLVERRGTLGWEIGRARRVFLDLKRWSEHSPILRELEGRLAREKAEVGKALSAPVVEFVLDAWVMEEGIQPLFFSLPVRVDTSAGAVTGITVANKSGYMQLTGPVVVETDHHGRLIRDGAETLATRQGGTTETADDGSKERTYVRACVLIGVPQHASEDAAVLTERLADTFGPGTVEVRPTLPTQVQIDLGLIDEEYADREHALSRLIPQVLAEIRQMRGWEKVGVAYIADDEWGPPPVRMPRAPQGGAKLGHLVGEDSDVPVYESDLAAQTPAGLFLAGPWIDKMLEASRKEELALIHRILIGDMVAMAVTLHARVTEGGR